MPGSAIWIFYILSHEINYKLYTAKKYVDFN